MSYPIKLRMSPGVATYRLSAGRMELSASPVRKTMGRQVTRCLFAAGLALAAVSEPAFAQETKTYTYDALGRVTNVQASGGPSNGTNAAYTYDPASNRTNVTVTGSPNGNGGGTDPNGGATVPTRRFVVVPLNGYSLIFYN